VNSMSSARSKQPPLALAAVSSVAVTLAATQLAIAYSFTPAQSPSTFGLIAFVALLGIWGGLCVRYRFPLSVVLFAGIAVYWPAARKLCLLAIMATGLTLVATSRLLQAPRGSVPSRVLATCCGWLCGFAVVFAYTAGGRTKEWLVALVSIASALSFGVGALVARRRGGAVSTPRNPEDAVWVPFFIGMGCFAVASAVVAVLFFGFYAGGGGSSAPDAWQPR
jgi:hypothetical protein